jgi:hypothetical protein
MARRRDGEVLIILEPLYMSKTTVHGYKFPVFWITTASNYIPTTISGIKKGPSLAYLAPFHPPPLPSLTIPLEDHHQASLTTATQALLKCDRKGCFYVAAKRCLDIAAAIFIVTN